MSEDASPSGSNREDQNSTWTVVKRKSRHSKRRAANPIDNKEESSPKKSPQTTDLPSVDELMAEYRRIRVQFETEPCAQKIRDLVAKNVVPGVRISNAINMGIGDFDPNDLLRPKRSSYVQLIAFQIMIEELGEFVTAILYSQPLTHVMKQKKSPNTRLAAYFKSLPSARPTSSSLPASVTLLLKIQTVFPSLMTTHSSMVFISTGLTMQRL